jgi:hypothetical protein
MKLKVFLAALAAGSALVFAPMAAAAPNENATNHAPDQAQSRGLSVAGVAGDGPGPVLDAITGFAPDAAQAGLAKAQCVAAGENCPE